MRKEAPAVRLDTETGASLAVSGRGEGLAGCTARTVSGAVLRTQSDSAASSETGLAGLS